MGFSLCGTGCGGTLKSPPGCRTAQGAKAGPGGYAKRVIHEKTGIELILIPAGSFRMGSDDPSGAPGVLPDQHEVTVYASYVRPAHEVTIGQPFYMGKTEVTNGQYRRFMQARPDYKGEADTDPAYELYLLHFKGKSVMSAEDEYPVVWVSWHNAQEFCAWAGLLLPSEAQWEYACRAGTTTHYSFGDDEQEQLCKHAWVDRAAGHRTHPVATKLPNPWGLYDVHGNVWEWCADDWVYGYEGAPTDGSARRAPEALNKILRGGSWNSGPAEGAVPAPSWYLSAALGSAARFNVAPGNAWHDRGFRIILPLGG